MADEDFLDEDGTLTELPLFANDEAKAIFAEIAKKRELLEKAIKEHGEHDERYKVMVEHLKNVRQEVSHTTGLMSAKEAEIKSEQHGAELAKREAGRYRQELRREQVEVEEHDSMLNALQNQVFQANEKMDQFKLQMNWNQEELEQWALAAKQKEEDNLAIQRYTRADEVKINALSLQIEKLTKLVKQWKDAIEASARRDKEITKTAAEYVEERANKEVFVDEIQAARDRLKKVREEYVEIQSKVSLMERQVQTRREDLMAEKTKLQRLEDEIDVLKSELASSARALLRKRRENERAAEEVVARRAHLERCRKLYHQSKQRLEVGDQNTAKVEQSAQEAEAELRANEVEQQKQDRALAALKESMFKQSQALFALRQEEANYIAEISGAQAQGRNLQSKIRQLDGESVRQQELIYNAEFQIQQMERKVARGLGERSDDEKRALNAQIEKLEAQLQEARDMKKMLTSQGRRLNNELRAAQRRGELAAQQQEELEARITELELENNSAEQSLKAQQQQEEEAMVQNDIMRLELKRLRDALSQRADKVFTLENRKQQLKLSMQERKKEIAVHKEVQAAQLRHTEEERHKAQIEAAQKREELQRVGDELDQEIRRREREMRALEATLSHVNSRNSQYRQSFQKANMKSNEAEDMKQLEEQAKLAQDALFRRKKELQRLSTDYEEDERRLQQVDAQCARLEERNGHLAEAHAQMEVELGAQDEALEKHEKRLARLSAMHRDKMSAFDETVQEKSFRAKSLAEATTSILRTLGALSKAYPELKDVMSNMLAEAGLAPEVN
ncbi:hypothetical protein JL720_14228 [Aureococcus anophagefferens]|nr:hypothetical protein JL720_14228 [Aureococcus anophagefferens]